MADQGRIRVAVVGLGFGAEFVPIYLDHPDVESVAVCDCDAARLAKAAGRFGVKRSFTDVAEVVRSAEIDAVQGLRAGQTDPWKTVRSRVEASPKGNL